MGLFTWIVVGLVAGALAKALMPGERREPAGLVGTILLGMVGGVLGGWVSTLLGGARPDGLNLLSVAVSVAGACLLIALLRLIRR